MAIEGKMVKNYFDPAIGAYREVPLEDYERFLRESVGLEEEMIEKQVEKTKQEAAEKAAEIMGLDASQVVITEEKDVVTIEAPIKEQTEEE
jgi:DUF1009 family protein